MGCVQEMTVGERAWYRLEISRLLTSAKALDATVKRLELTRHNRRDIEAINVLAKALWIHVNEAKSRLNESAP